MIQGLLYFIFTNGEKIHQKRYFKRNILAIAVSAKVPRQDPAVAS